MKTLTWAWVGLLGLTVFSLLLGQTMHGQTRLEWCVALLVWAKAWMVSEYYLEARTAHPFIRRVIRGFILFAPIGLVLSSLK